MSHKSYHTLPGGAGEWQTAVSPDRDAAHLPVRPARRVAPEWATYREQTPFGFVRRVGGWDEVDA